MASQFAQLLSILSLVLLGGWVHAKPMSSRLFYGSAESNLYRSEYLGGNTGFRAGELTYALLFQNEKRDFGPLLLTETTLGLSVFYQSGELQYGEVRLQLAPEVAFSADRRLQIEHHVVMVDFDAMFVLRGSQYLTSERTIPGTTLGLRRDIEKYFFELRGNVDQDQGLHSVAELRAGTKINQSFGLRVSCAAGEEIVDPGVFNQMRSISSSLLFNSSVLSLDFSYLTMWGNRRNETGVLAGIEMSW